MENEKIRMGRIGGCMPRALVCIRAESVCPRPEPGSTVEEPKDLRSRNGVLEAQLTANNSAQANGAIRYCYTDGAGHESPNLRVHPGDLVILHLKNALTDLGHANTAAMGMHMHAHASPNPCTSGIMSAVSTNLHFHGLTIPPVCHQDDVLKTSVQPGDAPFEYRFRIPDDEPPGLYWYHPHIHGFSKESSWRSFGRTDRGRNRTCQEGSSRFAGAGTHYSRPRPDQSECSAGEVGAGGTEVHD